MTAFFPPHMFCICVFYEQVLVLACHEMLFYYARDCCIDLRQISLISAVCHVNRHVDLIKGVFVILRPFPQNIFAHVMFCSLTFDMLFFINLKTRYKLYLCT